MQKTVKRIIYILSVLLVIILSALAGVKLYSGHLEKEALSSSTENNSIVSRGHVEGSRQNANNSSLISRSPDGVLSLYKGNEETSMPFKVTNMFPGDVVTRDIKLCVEHEISTEILFSLENTKGALADAMTITVLSDGEVIYDGPAKYAKAVFMVEKDKKDVLYTIKASLDTSVGNEYQMEEMRTDITWRASSDELSRPPKTGDDSRIIILRIMSLET